VERQRRQEAIFGKIVHTSLKFEPVTARISDKKKAGVYPAFFCLFAQPLLRSVNQFNISHWRIVAGSEPAFHDAQIAARSTLITRTQLIEQFGYDVAIAQFGESHTTLGHTVFFRQGDQWLCISSQLFGFRQGGLDKLMIDQSACHTAEQCLAMATGDAEFFTGFSVSHFIGT
jgi:hypothetical protein